MPTPEDAASAMLDRLRWELVSLRSEDQPLDAERRVLLRDWPRPVAIPERAAPQVLPPCRCLSQAVAAAGGGPMHDLVETIGPLLAALRWSYDYPVRPESPDLAARICFTQIIGPLGILDHDKVHVGLTLMVPQTLYPLHSHPAIETYLVLSGTAGWRVDDEAFGLRPPGTFVFHPGGIGHAMRTHDDPLLALYVWRGDLATAPIYIDDPGAADGC